MKIFQFYCMHTDCVNQINFWWYMMLYRVLYFSFPQAWFFYRLERLYPPGHSVADFVLKNTIIWPLYKQTVDGNIYSVILLAIYRVSQEECARLRKGDPYVKVYRYNPKHLCPKLNGYGDNGQGKVWSSGGSTHCTCQLTTLSMSALECGFILRQTSSRSL